MHAAGQAASAGNKLFSTKAAGTGSERGQLPAGRLT